MKSCLVFKPFPSAVNVFQNNSYLPASQHKKFPTVPVNAKVNDLKSFIQASERRLNLQIDHKKVASFDKKYNRKIEMLLKTIKAFNEEEFNVDIPEIEFLEYLESKPELIEVFKESKNQILEILIQDLVDYLLNERDPLRIPPSEIEALKRSLPAVYTVITGQRMREDSANDVVDQYLSVNDADYKKQHQRFNSLINTFLNTTNKNYLKFVVPEIMENLPLLITKLIYDALLHDKEKVNGYNTDENLFKLINRLDTLQQDLQTN